VDTYIIPHVGNIVIVSELALGTEEVQGAIAVAENRSRGERLQILLNEPELVAVENFRFTNRMPSRAAAVRELLRRGLAAEGFNDPLYGEKSEAFGVLSGPVGRKS
jgi:hypothetical protein